MKNLLITFLFFIISNVLLSQNDTIPIQDSTQYKIIKTDGGVLTGIILTQDARELLLLSNDQRQVYIPQHLIKEIIKIDNPEFTNDGIFIGEENFSTRYFITTNGLPLKKGNHYLQWNLYGPDFQFSLGKNFGIGIMTTWVAAPMVVNFKKSWQLGEKTHLAIGGLFGTISWALPDYGGALPFGTISFGDRKNNIAFSGGYGAIWYEGNVDGRALTSVAAMVKISNRLSLVFDSFILLPSKGRNLNNPASIYYKKNQPAFGIFIPGLRFHQNEGRAFQFGILGIATKDLFTNFPIPMVQWYRKL
ncbi:hypothetical protein ERX46_15675 [Brumimicrobium glaciale]|uniref:Uncharacterized protein n=1 Tax=Brumimicrobium glaciale TaxID=200475 RepID=A0A4Q4KH91_9FLAO|nr:hypothetical protein [Brumimicrobium glaciale]RYM32120.1 hypothetical protein ERX46_15675 [Brumimicrobium glaciale]